MAADYYISVDVVNGTIQGQTGTTVGNTTTYSLGIEFTYTVIANTPPSGTKFYNWTSREGGTFANATNTTTTYTVPRTNVDGKDIVNAVIAPEGFLDGEGLYTLISETKNYINNAIDALPEPMIFKGSLGTGGTITALPVNGTANIGDTYKVITAGTYASQAAKVGDTFICLTKTSNANTWELIPSGDEPSGTVTSITIKGTSPIVSSSSSAITTSGTRTISHATSGVSAGTYKSVTVNTYGHVTGGTNPTTISGYGITDAKIDSGTITLGSNTITPLTSHQDISGKEDSSNKVTSLSSSSTNTQYPSAKLVYDQLALKQTKIYTDLTEDLYFVDGTAPTLPSGMYYCAGHSVYINGTKQNILSSNPFYFIVDELEAGEDQWETYYTINCVVGTSFYSAACSTDNNLTWVTKIDYLLRRANIDTSIINPARDTQVPSTKLFVTQLATKQNTLSQGTNITISGNTISATDTKNTAGSTDTSSKIYLVGATSQAANPQTYSDDEVYATSGTLTAKEFSLGTNAKIVYNTSESCIEFSFS